jgi:hypothetical protein
MLVRTIPRVLLVPVGVLALAGIVFGVWLFGHPTEGVSMVDNVAIVFVSVLLLAIVAIAWSLPFARRRRRNSADQQS